MGYDFQEIGHTVRMLRRQRFGSQEAFLDALAQEGLRIGRNKLSAIENGRQEQFTLPFLLTCCRLFDCQLGYLMGEYDAVTMDAQAAREYTGLPEEAITLLHSKSWLWNREILFALTLLLADRVAQAGSGETYAPSALSLLAHFLSPKTPDTRWALMPDGRLREVNPWLLPADAIPLNAAVAENIALAELQTALQRLKRRCRS